MIQFLCDTTAEADERLWGGKGANLLRLTRYGFNVPKGFIISTHAYDLFLKYNNLKPLIEEYLRQVSVDNFDNAEMRSSLHSLQDLILKGALPEQLILEVESSLKKLTIIDRPLVVRSSASLEDSQTASFAGIHDSFLNLRTPEAVLESVKKCYASLWSERAVAYRLKMAGHESIKQALVIMELVEAQASGVAFTCHPLTGRPDLIVINANFGLGEAVVSGAIEPDQYELSTKELVPALEQKTLGKKEGMSIPSEEGGIQFVDKVGAAQTQVLLDEAVVKLALIVRRVYDTLGKGSEHQDIEWVYDGQGFQLVQARPVTKHPRYTYDILKNQPDIWSNSNMKDAMPMVLPQYGWQFLKLISEETMNTPIKVTGYPLLKGVEFTRLFNGRGYFNLSLMQWVFFDGLGISPKDFNDMTGGHQPEISVPPVMGKSKVEKLWRTLRLVRAMQKAQKGSPLAFARARQYTDEFTKKDLSHLGDRALIHEFLTTIDECMVYTKTFALGTNASGFSYYNLAKSLDKVFPQQGTAITNKLMMGQGNITSAEHGYRLVELADLAKKDSEAMAFFDAPSFNPLAWKESFSSDSPFGIAFGDFLKEFGHRAVYEGDISNPRWLEDPSYLLKHIKSIMNTSNFAKLKASQGEVSQKGWQEIMTKVPFYKRRIVKYYVKKTVKDSEFRESAKSHLVLFAATGRSLALEIEKRLLDRGILQQAGDIFHCSWSEMISILREDWDGKGLDQIIKERKQRMEEFKSLIAPDNIIDGVPQKVNRPQAELSSDSLKGLGVATGKTEGVVRIIRHPDEGHVLKQGEILVAPSTDPAWTPLFLKASGIIMETGGFLSHGAIVAREYGIPGVVNVSDILNILKDGEHVIVDGDEGKIYRG
ncbi:MAG: PEP/pyruvate-binding domain-containing protein [Desulfitobacterium sp.]